MRVRSLWTGLESIWDDLVILEQVWTHFVVTRSLWDRFVVTLGLIDHFGTGVGSLGMTRSPCDKFRVTFTLL